MKVLYFILLSLFSLTQICNAETFPGPKPIEQEKENKEEALQKHKPNKEKKMTDILKNIVTDNLKRIIDTSNTTKSDSENNIKGFVLSTHIRNFSDIPKNIDAEINQVKEGIRLVIRRVATEIEISGGNSGSLKIDDDSRITYEPNPNLPKALNEKRKQLLTANLKNTVSVSSAVMAVHLLADINDGLKTQAQTAKTRQQKEKVYIKQAIYVYEMANITLELLNSLSLEGKETIHKLYEDAQERVQDRVSNIDKMILNAKELKKQGLMTDEQVTKEKETYDLMSKATKESLEAWKDFIVKVGKQEDFLTKLKTKKSLIEYKRDKAKIQLETLRDLRQVAELQDTIGSLDDLVSSVASLDLLVLDENTVSVLLGYDIDE